MCDSVSARPECTPLGNAAPLGRVWRPLRRGLQLQQCRHGITELNVQVLNCRRRTTIFDVGREDERTKAIPFSTELRIDDSRKIVREFIAFIGAQEGLAGPELLNFCCTPELSMSSAHFLGSRVGGARRAEPPLGVDGNALVQPCRNG